MSGSPVVGSEEARSIRFSKLFEEHRPALLAAARRGRCRSEADIADLVADTFARGWKNFASLRDESRALGWLVKIMSNLRIDRIRRQRAEVPLEQIEEPCAPTEDEPEGWEARTMEDYRVAIEELREPYRTVAILRDLDHLTNAEVSARLGTLPSTVATQHHRAHGMLREAFQAKLRRTKS